MSETTSQELVSVSDAVVESAAQQVASLARGDLSVYSTITDKSFEGRAAVYSAISTAVPLRDHLNTTIPLVNFVAQAVTLNDEETGGTRETIRVILVATDGSAFYGISGVLFNDVKNLIAIMGHPSSWPSPVPVYVAEERSSGARRFMTLKIGEAPKSK